MKNCVTAGMGLIWLLGGLFAAGNAIAEPERHGRHHQGHHGMHHQGDDDKHHRDRHGMRHQDGGGAMRGQSGGMQRQCEHHMQHHGAEAGAGAHERHGHHGKSDAHSTSWRQTLTPEQRTQIDGLRVNHMKIVAPLRASIRAVKTELAVLATADAPDSASMQTKLDELLEMKKQVMLQRYEHMASVRKILTAEQRISFDTMLLKKVNRRGMRPDH